MLRITSNELPHTCEGTPRREFLRIGALGLGGLTLPQLLATCLVEMVGHLDENRDEKAFLAVAAGGSRDMTRSAASLFAPGRADLRGTNADRIRAAV